jgi:hypothetical protein
LLAVLVAACAFESHSLPLRPEDGEDAGGASDAAPPVDPPDAARADDPGPDAEVEDPGDLLPFGAPCELAAECADGLCERIQGDLVCTRPCALDVDCPGSAECDEQRGHCIPDGDGEGGGGWDRGG